MRRQLAGPVRGALLLGLPIALGGCLPVAATEQGRSVNELWTQFLVAAALVGGLVWTLITVAIVRFRRRPGDAGSLPPQIGHSARLEAVWTAGPILIVLALFWLTLGALGRIDAREPGRVTVDVLAYRWQWRFDYEGTGVTLSGTSGQPAEMVVPAGEPIHIVLTSADVAHSFFVPAFLFKRDAIPGRSNEFDVTIPEPGAYGGQCAEFCGVFHDRMLLTVRAVPRAEYDAWIAARQTAAAGSPASTTGGPAPTGSSADAP